MRFMTAGAIYGAEHGDLRVIRGTVNKFDPDDPRAVDGYVPVPGKIVQTFVPLTNAEGFPLLGGGRWEDLCPLCDFAEMYPDRTI